MKQIKFKSNYFKLYRAGLISNFTNNQMKIKVEKVIRDAKNEYFTNQLKILGRYCIA